MYAGLIGGGLLIVSVIIWCITDNIERATKVAIGATVVIGIGLTF